MKAPKRYGDGGAIPPKSKEKTATKSELSSGSLSSLISAPKSTALAYGPGEIPDYRTGTQLYGKSLSQSGNASDWRKQVIASGGMPVDPNKTSAGDQFYDPKVFSRTIGPKGEMNWSKIGDPSWKPTQGKEYEHIIQDYSPKLQGADPITGAGLYKTHDQAPLTIFANGAYKPYDQVFTSDNLNKQATPTLPVSNINDVQLKANGGTVYRAPKRYADGGPVYDENGNIVNPTAQKQLADEQKKQAANKGYLDKTFNTLSDPSTAKAIQSGDSVAVAGKGIDLGADLLKQYAQGREMDLYSGNSEINNKDAKNIGGLSGAATGAKMGAKIGLNPELMAATGGLSALAVPVGAGIGLGVGRIQGNNKADAFNFGVREAKSDKLRSEQEETQANNLNKQMVERQAGYAKGGEIKGKGTGKSDSIDAKVKAGSFIVPVEKVPLAKEVKKMIAPSKKKEVADLDEKGGEKVKLSNGEFKFTPEEKNEIISELGEEFLNHLAPNSEHKDESFHEGGLTPGKAKIMLKDNQANGKPLTEKQRGYFGLIASGYKCGGMVNGYKEGGDVGDGNGEREKLAKEEAAIKTAEEKKAQEARNFEGAKKIKTANDRVAMYRKMYDDYDKQFKTIPIEGAQGKARIRAKKELLDKVDAEEKNFKEVSAQYGNADKKTGASGINYMGNGKSTIPSKSGAEIDKINKGSNIPVSNKLVPQNNIYTGPKGETSDVTIPQEKVTNKSIQTPDEKALTESAQGQEKAFSTEKAANDAKQARNKQLLQKGLGIAGNELSGLSNYIVPFKQYQMGQQFLAKSGARPVGKIDPDFQRSVNQAQANAQYGYTPEEQSLINTNNVNALRSGQNAARMYSGGSDASALSLSRQAGNDYFSRGLQAAVNNKQLKQDKQLYADQLNSQKAGMNRQLFQDNLNAWKENQAAGGNLVGAGISNMLAASRLNKESQFQNELNAKSNPWANYNING